MKIIKQFGYSGFKDFLHAQIIQTEDGKFRWEISHHYKPSQNAGIYYPSTVSGDSLTEVEEHLEMYVKNFTDDFGVKKNVDFIFDDEILDDDRQDKIERLVGWFYENFQDPAEGGLYYENKEGGFHGDIRDASDELQNQFPFASDDIIEAAVKKIESHGGHQWTPIHDSKKLLIDELNTLIDSAPEQKTAPTFAVGPDNLFYITLPSDNQPINRQDVSLKKLRETIEALLESRIGANAHQQLTPVIEEYRWSILGEQISISQLYWSGIRLGDAVRIIKRDIEAKEQPPLPFDTELNLDSVLKIHGNYIMSNAEGRRLVQDAADYRQSAEQTEALKQASEQFADSVAENQDLFGADVREYVPNILRETGGGQYPERSNQSAINVVTNMVLGLVKFVGIVGIGAIIGGAVVASVPGMATSALGAEAINIAGFFLVNNAHLLSMLAIPLAGEQSWLALVADLLERIRLMINRKK